MTNINQNFEKRNSLSKEKCFERIKDHWFGMYNGYYNGVIRYNEVVREMKYSDIRRRVDSSILNYWISSCLRDEFPENYRKGKYGRVIFRFNGTQMLVKKLDKRSKPTYIKSMTTDAILNQNQLSLFEDEEGIEEPILFFGYTKDEFGTVSDPRIVYYDNGVQWMITENDFKMKQIAIEQENTTVPVSLKTRERKAE